MLCWHLGLALMLRAPAEAYRARQYLQISACVEKLPPTTTRGEIYTLQMLRFCFILKD